MAFTRWTSLNRGKDKGKSLKGHLIVETITPKKLSQSKAGFNDNKQFVLPGDFQALVVCRYKRKGVNMPERTLNLIARRDEDSPSPYALRLAVEDALLVRRAIQDAYPEEEWKQNECEFYANLEYIGWNALQKECETMVEDLIEIGVLKSDAVTLSRILDREGGIAAEQYEQVVRTIEEHLTDEQKQSLDDPPAQETQRHGNSRALNI